MGQRRNESGRLELVILGSGTCAVTLRRSTACYYLRIGETQVLLDIGFGAIRRMLEAGIDHREIDYVFCSHRHPDHVADLGPLLMALRHTPGYQRQKPLTLIGPSGFRQHMECLSELCGDWIIAAKGYDLRIEEMHNETKAFGDWQVTALTMAHSQFTNGYRFQYRDRVLSYSADTGLCDQLISLVQDADLALMECSFPDEQGMEGHLTPTSAGQVAERAACKRLLLTHFYPMMDDIEVTKICARAYHGRIDVTEDLQRIVL